MARFDWVSLTVARFAPVFPICLLYCVWPSRWGATRRVIKSHWRRLVVSGFLCVPGYNLALYYGQGHGVPAPIASVTTTLAPIFILALSILFLGEKLTKRRVIGLGCCIAGMTVIACSRREGAGSAYPLVVAMTSLAPLSWSIFSVITKPLMKTVEPIHWTFLAILFGSTPTMMVLPWIGGPELMALDRTGWLWILYLAILATVIGFALWSWLLRHLPASTVGLTVFLNPPLTTVSKLILASALPAAVAFQVTPLEGVGGAIVLAGLGIAVLQKPAPKSGSGTGSGRGHEAESSDSISTPTSERV